MSINDRRGNSGTHDPADDAWLESMLRDEAATTAYVSDDGFTESLLTRLPAQTRPLARRWIVPAMALFGCLVGGVWLSGGEDLTLILAGLLQLKSLSLQNLLVAALPLGVLYWLALGAAWEQR